jgi:putative FmdB family regulatory protein
MPTYHYKCGQCAHEFDEFQSIMDEPLTDCPECGGKIVRVITGGSGVLFKGSGFYQTDYRSKSYEKGAAKDRPSSVDSGSSDSGKKSSDS